MIFTGNYSRLICKIDFSRAMGYYLIQIYIPSSLIVIISWVSFWLHRNASPARVQLGVTTVLTMTTLMSSTNSALPKISYVKSIDVFLGTCFVMVFAALLEYATVGYLGKRIAMRKARAEQIQKLLEQQRSSRMAAANAAAAAAASATAQAQNSGHHSASNTLHHPSDTQHSHHGPSHHQPHHGSSHHMTSNYQYPSHHLGPPPPPPLPPHHTTISAHLFDGVRLAQTSGDVPTSASMHEGGHTPYVYSGGGGGASGGGASGANAPYRTPPMSSSVSFFTRKNN